MLQSKAQTFNDGVCTIYSDNGTGLAKKAGPLRYQHRTVGAGRFWQALQSQARIDKLIRLPRISGITSNDVAVLSDGIQYLIRQVQQPTDIKPDVMDLSLEESMNPKTIPIEAGG
jgi:hypothetical protein